MNQTPWRSLPTGVTIGLLIALVTACDGPGSGNSTEGNGPGQPDGAPVVASNLGAYCCALVMRGYDCGWNWSTAKAQAHAAWQLGLSGEEALCEEEWKREWADSSSTCDDRVPTAVLLECTQEPSVATTTVAQWSVPNSYAIPDGYPQLSGEVAGIGDFEFQAGSFAMTSIGRGLYRDSGGAYYFAFLGDPFEDHVLLRIKSLEPGLYEGGDIDTSPVSVAVSTGTFTDWYSDWEFGCNNEVARVTIVGSDEYAVWGDFDSILCNADTNVSSALTGRFSLLLPEINAK